MNTEDLTPNSDAVEPFKPGETLSAARATAILLAAAQLLLSRRRGVDGGFWFEAARWLTRLSGEVGPSGSDISDEVLGGLALANIVLRAHPGDPVYRAGREDAARAIEDAANMLVPVYAPPDEVTRQAVLTAQRAAQIARGLQPREAANP